MKKIIVLLTLVLCFGLSFSTYTSAKDESNAELKKKVAQLEKQVRDLKADNAKLKKSVPSVISGKIYQNGVRSGSSNFVKMGSKSYVEIDNIIPLLTSYTDQQVKFDYKGKSLYLGVMPSKGVIGLTNMDYYEEQRIVYIDSDITINNKRYPKNMYGYYNDSSITYKLDGKYSSFKFFYGMLDGARYTGKISINGDGNEIFHSGEINFQENAKYVNVNVKGMKYIKITFSSSAAIGNPTLTP